MFDCLEIVDNLTEVDSPEFAWKSLDFGHGFSIQNPNSDT